MNFYKKSAWFAALVSIILIIKSLITSIFSTDLGTITIMVANILPAILLYVSICLLKAKDRSGSATTASVAVSIVSFLWLASLIPGLPVMAVAVIVMVNFILSVVALLAINWYVGKVAGLVITIVILFVIMIFVGSYGADINSSLKSQTSTTTQI